MVYVVCLHFCPADSGLMFIGSGASDKTQPGTVHVLSTVDRSSPAAPMSRGSLTAGPLPDMILPNSDCTKLAVGNEGHLEVAGISK